MALPQLNFNPPFHIVRVSHTEWGVTDIPRAKKFYVDTLGYHCQDETEDTLFLRGIEEVNHHSLILTKAEHPVVSRIAFKVASDDDLERAQRFFESIGSDTAWVDRYAQGRTLHTRDPFGVPLEFYAEMECRELLLQQYGRHRGARIQRIDHVNLFHPDVNEATRFYVSELGFRPTEVTLADVQDPDSDIWAAWIQRRGGVHDIAFTNGAGPRLHHIGLYVPCSGDIIDFCDILAGTGRLDAFERGPGRHGISNAFFLYIRDPDGHRIELFTSDYLTVDPDHPVRLWDLKDPRRQTLWGQPAPRSWFEQGVEFEGTNVTPSQLSAEPIIAPD